MAWIAAGAGLDCKGKGKQMNHAHDGPADLTRNQGLVLSFRFSLASGPAIILVAGAFYLISLLFGTRGIVRARQREHRHRTA
jgi:hypothetical protein